MAQLSERLPAAPLIDRIERAGGLSGVGMVRDGSARSERLAKAYYRALSRGWVTFAAADDLAVHILGAHPSELWGDDYYGVGTALEGASA